MLLYGPNLRWFSAALHSLYAAQTPGQVAAAAIAAIGRRFELGTIACEEISHRGSDYALHGAALAIPLPAETPVYLHDHPMMPWVHNMPPLAQVRGMVSRATFERTDYFNGIARPLGFNDHVILRAQQSPTSVTLSLCRDKVFTPDECELLRLFQPHLDVAWRRAGHFRHALGPAGPQCLRLSATLRPVDLTAVHLDWLQNYFPGWRDARRLPAMVRDWALETRRQLQQGATGQLPRILSIDGPQGTLLLRYFPLPESGTAELRLAERRREPGPGALATRLSPREREVLHWIAEGKRDGEIALILGVSPKTVSKHVEHILAKLRVSNRTAALNRLG